MTLTVVGPLVISRNIFKFETNRIEMSFDVRPKRTVLVKLQDQICGDSQ
jgi:hypothetical protein